MWLRNIVGLSIVQCIAALKISLFGLQCVYNGITGHNSKACTSVMLICCIARILFALVAVNLTICDGIEK